MTHSPNEIDSLEHRRFCSVSLDGDALQVSGTAAGDVIQLVSRPTRVLVIQDGLIVRRLVSGRVARAVVNAGNGDDRVDLSLLRVPAFVRGEAGDDWITGGAVNDRLLGGNGNDRLDGGDGNDRLDGGAGADLLVGGAGTDSVDYIARKDDLTIGIGGGHDDGAAGERDNVALDVENILCGAGDDFVRGSRFNNLISGGAGNDLIHGLDGHDSLSGDAGNDTLGGDDDNDRITGGSGDDALFAGGGRTNYLYGNDGNDYLDARNDSTDDAIDGGIGDDIGKFDWDLLSSDDRADNTRSIEDERPEF